MNPLGYRWSDKLIRHDFGALSLIHPIATEGCFSIGGAFSKGPAPAVGDQEELFRDEVSKILKAEGKISDAVIENMLSWHHSDFIVYCSPAIWPNNDQSFKDLACYIIHAFFSQERITYLPAKGSLDGQAKVIYKSNDRWASKTFEAFD